MPELRRLPPEWRALALGFVSVSLLATGLAFFYVHATSTFTPAGIQARFAGPETPDITPVTAGELLQTTHTHLFTMAFLQLLAGGIFLLGSAVRRLKTWMVAGGFGLILLDHAGMWLTKAVSPGFAPALILSGASLGMVFLMELGWSFWDLTFGCQGDTDPAG
jgi:hypothetical protein